MLIPETSRLSSIFCFQIWTKIRRHGWFQLEKLRVMYCFRNCSLIRSPSNAFNLAAIKDRFTFIGSYYQLSPLILLYANNLTTSFHNYIFSIFLSIGKQGQCSTSLEILKICYFIQWLHRRQESTCNHLFLVTNIKLSINMVMMHLL